MLTRVRSFASDARAQESRHPSTSSGWHASCDAYGARDGPPSPHAASLRAARHGGCWPAFARTLRRAGAAGGGGHAFSPFSFPPLETPFPDSPFSSGPHQRGKTAGGQRTAALMENGASPALRAGLFPGAVFPAALRVPAATPPLGRPLRHGPAGAGRVGRVGHGSARLTRARPFKDGEPSARRKTVAPWFAVVVELQGSPPLRARLPSAVRFKLPVVASLLRDAAAILSFKRPSFTLSPDSCHGACWKTGTRRASPRLREDAPARHAGDHDEANTFPTQPPIQWGRLRRKSVLVQWLEKAR
jgi:hypothetical protein